jgi:hypothetical protein
LLVHDSNRRTFLRHASAFAITSGLLSGVAAHGENTPPPTPGKIPSRDTLLKFSPDGSKRPFAGNTVICHLPVQGAVRDALVALHEDLQQSPYRSRLGLTSPESYHMTIFPGANDLDRQVSGWPSYVAPDAAITECSHLVGERMAKAQLHCALPLRMRLDGTYTLRYPTACTMRLLPVDDAEEKKLRGVRDQLSEVYGFRLRNHDSYEFHMTVSYQLSPFTNEEQLAYRALLGRHLRQIAEAAPVIEYGVPEYCTFPDMFRFDVQKLLACSV